MSEPLTEAPGRDYSYLRWHCKYKYYFRIYKEKAKKIK